LKYFVIRQNGSKTLDASLLFFLYAPIDRIPCLSLWNSAKLSWRKKDADFSPNISCATGYLELSIT